MLVASERMRKGRCGGKREAEGEVKMVKERSCPQTVDLLDVSKVTPDGSVTLQGLSQHGQRESS